MSDHLIRRYTGWQAPERDPKTKAPVADPKKFPHGIKYVADEIHKMGLKVVFLVAVLRTSC